MKSECTEIADWLRAFSATVRARDYEAAALLFAPDVLGFGTVANQLEGIQDLVARQWEVVWESTRDFEFDYSTLRCEVIGDRAWAAALWSSSSIAGDPVASRRSGRATLLIARIDREWRAIHSHFSLTPSGAP